MTLYLDHNATTPLDERVLEAMLPYLRGSCGNPSSRHLQGRLARSAIDQAREQVAALVNAHPGQVIFTSGGTEANNLAFKGMAERCSPGRIAVSAVEHPSVLEPAERLARHDWQIDSIGVDSDGRLRLEALERLLHQADLKLISIMLANNETGTIQDLNSIKETMAECGALLHSDAVQAVGKMEVDFRRLGVDLMTLSSHKIYGPKGAGALIADRSVGLEAQMDGGGQERGLRAGTENVAAIVGFGRAAELALSELQANSTHMLELRNYLESKLAEMSGVVCFAQQAERLPNTLFMSVAGVDGEMLLMQMDRHDTAISSGSACASGKTEPSHVLVAMGVDKGLARGAVRISLGKNSSREDVDSFCRLLAKVTDEMAQMGAMMANG
ncbi:cysteine desulfurase [Solemya pervernicosa gill symbiont]|uniref:cysteine desulfurase n=2 Tax=Gammaproteobacteria incertae sedis TaxID=118884 RepID=A0A1T2LAQ3_9GAMM|nr:cysteine desulfurase family protein [Candidatus Reidiella endopervernicosa]OOZ42185.1 cysteine desulfurase [Solemya pervernicosa gill symbiont]QKQ27246.1 cysteine desulfurase [Candidatus Reidiella endopervernicosa]